MSQTEISALIAEFSNRITLLMRRSALEQVLASLGGAPPAAKRGPGRPRGSTTARPAKAAGRVRRSSIDLAGLGQELLAHVRANPGQRGEQIAAALKTDVGTMRLPMKQLIAEKKVRTEGQRRGMQYFPAGASGAAAAPKAPKGKRKAARRRNARRVAKRAAKKKGVKKARRNTRRKVAKKVVRKSIRRAARKGAGKVAKRAAKSTAPRIAKNSKLVPSKTNGGKRPVKADTATATTKAATPDQVEEPVPF